MVLDHVAESGPRAISLCTMTGQAAGVAAALAVEGKVAPDKIAVQRLQNILVSQNIKLPGITG